MKKLILSFFLTLTALTVSAQDKDLEGLYRQIDEAIDNFPVYVARHEAQINWYRTAVERLTETPVKEMWLFALRSGQACGRFSGTGCCRHITNAVAGAMPRRMSGRILSICMSSTMPWAGMV